LKAVPENARRVHQRMKVVGMSSDDFEKSGFRFIPSALTPQLPGALKFRQVAFFKRAGCLQHRLFDSGTRPRGRRPRP
jgi:hypothetical protein